MAKHIVNIRRKHLSGLWDLICIPGFRLILGLQFGHQLAKEMIPDASVESRSRVGGNHHKQWSPLKITITKHDRRKFRSQASDNMDRWKAEQGRGREKRKIRREKSRRERVRSKKICGSGGSKSRLAKAAGAEPAGQMRDEKVHAVVARSTFPSQNVQNSPGADHFWHLRCRKSARVVARTTFPSQNVQNTPASDDIWKLRCRKTARPCGVKHISKWTCTKQTSFGTLLEVEMSQKCKPLWREAHFQVKMYKTHHVRTVFGGSDVVLRGRRKGLCTLSKVSKTWGFCGISKKAMASVGHLKRICKNAFRVARAAQKTCSREMLGGQGAR